MYSSSHTSNATTDHDASMVVLQDSSVETGALKCGLAKSAVLGRVWNCVNCVYGSGICGTCPGQDLQQSGRRSNRKRYSERFLAIAQHHRHDCTLPKLFQIHMHSSSTLASYRDTLLCRVQIITLARTLDSAIDFACLLNGQRVVRFRRYQLCP